LNAGQQPVGRHLVAETLASQGLADTWRRSLVVDNFDQASTVIPVVRIFCQFLDKSQDGHILMVYNRDCL
jgi:hypothetical protein